jgi:hypothetical protein
MDSILERQRERMAAQAAVQAARLEEIMTAQEARMTAQTQQLNQLMASYIQSQAAGNGGGGLGLAKGDG